MAIATSGSGAALTPPQDDLPSKGYGSWVPHDLTYNREFEDSLIDVVLDGAGNSSDKGIRVIPEDSDEAPIEGVSVRLRDIDLSTLPNLTEHDLPIPLTDARRIYASPIPGIKVTHPYGWIEGGPSLDPNMDTFADDFLSQHQNITNYEQLQREVQKEVDANIELLKTRLRARREAKEKNEDIAKQIRTLTDQHELELRLQQRALDERKAKQDSKRRRAEKEGGG